jgi:hypothetical protein
MDSRTVAVATMQLCFTGGVFHRKDGKLRANDFAVMTVHAVFRVFYTGRVVPLLIESGGELEHLSWTELNTVSTPLASVLKNMHQSARDLDLLCIKGRSPEPHISHFSFRGSRSPLSISFPVL